MSQVGQLPQEAAEAPESGRDPRRLVAKLDYEIGFSLRVIGAKVGVSEAAIRLWAKEEGWPRPVKVQTTRAARAAATAPAPAAQAVIAATASQATQNASQVESEVPICEVETAKCEPKTAKCEVQGHDKPLDQPEPPLDQRFRQRVRELLENPTRDEAVDVAARAVVQVVKEHRTGLTKAQMLCDRLLGQLDIATVTRDELEEFIVSVTEPGKYRSMLMKLVQLPSHAGVIRDLAGAMQRLVTMERQAFGLGQADDPTPPPAIEQPQPAESSAFDRIRERVQLRLAGGTAA